MKNLTVAAIVVAIGIGIILTLRYELKIDSPVVAKLDRFTGDTWVASAGLWRKVQHLEERPQTVSPKAK